MKAHMEITMLLAGGGQLVVHLRCSRDRYTAGRQLQRYVRWRAPRTAKKILSVRHVGF